VRGDSIRDLYAKVLAILGLGALAAAGAVVDYWPVSSEVPRVASVRRGLVPAPPVLARAGNLVVPSAPAPAPFVRHRPRPVSQPGAPTATAVEYTLTSTTESEIPAGELITLSAPTRPSLALAVAEHVPASDVGLPPALLPVTPPDALPSAMRAPSTERADGFLSGALKKTGESVVKTGVATGASIVEAFRGVMGAFKKVSPFNDDASAFKPAGL
jgi:hypothetical protein